MSAFLMGQALRIAGLKTSKKILLVALCDHAKDDGSSVYPSVATLAARCTLSPRQVTRLLGQLVNEGYLLVIGNHNGGSGTKRYQIAVGKMFAATGDKISSLPNIGMKDTALSPDTHVILPLTPVSPETSNKHQETFNSFWALFPKIRAGSKDKAAKAFCRAMDRAPTEEIMAGLQAYVDSDEPFKENGRYAKGAEAWLNDDRWTNDYGRIGTQNAKKPARMAVEDIMF